MVAEMAWPSLAGLWGHHGKAWVRLAELEGFCQRDGAASATKRVVLADDSDRAGAVPSPKRSKHADGDSLQRCTHPTANDSFPERLLFGVRQAQLWQGARPPLPDGWTQETCRDLVHTQYGLAALLYACDVAAAEGHPISSTEASRHLLGAANYAARVRAEKRRAAAMLRRAMSPWAAADDAGADIISTGPRAPPHHGRGAAVSPGHGVVDSALWPRR